LDLTYHFDNVYSYTWTTSIAFFPFGSYLFGILFYYIIW